MKLKIANIIGILLTVIIIGGILYPWSKRNMKEGFGTASDAAVLPLFQFLLDTRRHANKYRNKIQKLKTAAEQNLKTVNGEDYIKYITNIKDKVDKLGDDYKDIGGTLIKSQINEETIQKLQQNIQDFETIISNIPPSTSDQTSTTSTTVIPFNNIGSIKSISSGINMNVKHLNEFNLKTETYNNLFKNHNLDKNLEIIMIHMNNGCLTYDSDGKYFSKYCELTNSNQYFIFKIIKDGNQLLEHLTGDYNTKQKLINSASLEENFPFNIIYPMGNKFKCVKIDIEGISIEDCKSSDINLDQRWLSLNTSNKSCY